MVLPSPESTGSRRQLPLHGIVIPIPEPEASSLRDLQNQLARAADVPLPPLEDPHITLKMPFFWKGAREELPRALSQALRNTMPFTVRAAGLGCFTDYHNTVYVRLEDADPLCRLHQAVVDVLDAVKNRFRYTPFIEGAHYVPHVTIAHELTAEEVKLLARHASQIPARFPIHVRDVLLRRREPGADWELEAEFQLS